MSARLSRPSPSSPATTRSPCSSCCPKCGSSPSTSQRILSSVKVRSEQRHVRISEVLMPRPLGMLQYTEGIWVPCLCGRPKGFYKFSPATKTWAIIVCPLASVRSQIASKPQCSIPGSTARLRRLLCSTKMLQHSPRGFSGLLHTEEA